jgi:hypothetical protein
MRQKERRCYPLIADFRKWSSVTSGCKAVTALDRSQNQLKCMISLSKKLCYVEILCDQNLTGMLNSDLQRK